MVLVLALSGDEEKARVVSTKQGICDQKRLYDSGILRHVNEDNEESPGRRRGGML